MDYNEILGHFNIEEIPVKVDRWGEGHIHDTFLVETENHKPDYILQKINQHVFRNIPGMMGNIRAVTGHIRQKLGKLPGHDPEMEALTLIGTKSGQSWYEDREGNCWRVYVFIPGTVTYQKLDDPALAKEAGRAIGAFQALLSDLEQPLVVTIPDFHNMNHRIRGYNEAKLTDPAKRAATVVEEITFAEQRFGTMKDYYRDLLEKATLRATHNDTKVNNILFDKNNKALCLIDLDTVMPGYAHFDYGDALRTMANTALEDERDLSKVHFNKSIYEAFTGGYLQETGSFLNNDELKMLPYAPVYLTFIIGLRFLTDYLNGDTYFRVHYPGHNLTRARVQFRLVAEMEKVLG